MTQEEMRLALVNSTVKVVANDGLDKTTTKAISTAADLNEVYIYRLFEGKEDLLKKSFEMLDKELIDAVYLYLPIMYNNERDFVTNCRTLFCAVWNFLLGNREKCVCYMRYLYYPYFQKHSAESHAERVVKVVEGMTPAFADGSDVYFFLNHMLNIMLSFAIKVFEGDLTNDNETAEMIFTIVFSSVRPYLAPQLGLK